MGKKRLSPFYLALILIGSTGMLGSCSKSGSEALTLRSLPQTGELTKAAAVGNLDDIRALLQKGADVNENLGTTVDEVTPLLAAIVRKREDIALLLLDRGAAVHATYQGYQARDYSLLHLGSQSPVTRRLARVNGVNHE